MIPSLRRSLLIAAILSGGLLPGVASAVSVEVVDFEDLADEIAASSEGFVTLPAPYEGFNWSGATWSVGALGPSCGALPGDCPASIVAFNAAETAAVPVTISWAGEAGLGFIPVSVDLASAFSQGFTIAGYQGATEVFSYSPLAVTATRSTFDLGGDKAFTSIVITGSASDPNRRTWVMDNFRYQVTAIPEPSTWVLLGAGLLGIGTAARRRRG